MTKNRNSDGEIQRYPDGTPVEYSETGAPYAFSEMRRIRKERNFWARQAELPLSMWRAVRRRKAQRFTFTHGKGGE